MALGGEGAVAGRDYAQHALFQLHADVDIGRVAGGVEPEGLVDLVGERALDRPVHRAEQRIALEPGELRARLQGDREIERPFGPILQARQSLRRRIVLVAQDQ